MKGIDVVLRAVLFGKVGSLVECSEIERRAYNKAFAEAGMDWVWDPFTFRALKAICSDRLRVKEYAAMRNDQVDATALLERQSFHFKRSVAEGVRMRPGLQETICAARAHRVKLGLVASTGSDILSAVIDATYGALNMYDFDHIGCAADQAAPKPAPDLYTDAIRKLGVGPQQVVAIEDNPASAQAALAAGIRTIGFPGAYASDTFDDRVVRVDRLSPAAVGLSAPMLQLAG